MPKPELTKLLLAQTVKQLSRQKPLDKLSIGEISDSAGINRKTFYYHFANKQEIICWIFDYDILNITDKNQNNTILDDIVEYMYSEKSFYVNALNSDAQNNLSTHIYNVTYKRMILYIKSLLGTRHLDIHHISIFANLLSLGIVGMLGQWARAGMKKDAVDLMTEYGSLITEMVSVVINEYAK